MYVFLFLRNNICTMITMGSKNSLLKFHPSLFYETAVFPHIRPTDISISHSLQMWVLLENTTFSLQQGLEIRGFWFQKKTVQLKTALCEVYIYVLKGIFFQKTVYLQGFWPKSVYLKVTVM